MAENVAVTSGSGVTVGADEVTIGGTSQKIQRVKILDGTNDSTNVLLVDSTSAVKTRVNSGTIVVSHVNAGTVAVSGGQTAHDAATTGNPLRVGVRARGTISGITAVSTNDAVELAADTDGVLLTRHHIPLSAVLTTRVIDTSGSSTAFTNLGATTLLRNYITSIAIYNNGATSVYYDFRNGTGGSIFWTQGAPIKAVSHMTFNPPLRQPSTNTALAYDGSAAIGGSGVIVGVTGFQANR